MSQVKNSEKETNGLKILTNSNTSVTQDKEGHYWYSWGIYKWNEYPTILKTSKSDRIWLSEQQTFFIEKKEPTQKITIELTSQKDIFQDYEDEGYAIYSEGDTRFKNRSWHMYINSLHYYKSNFDWKKRVCPSMAEDEDESQ